MGHPIGIWAIQLGFGPAGWDLGEQVRFCPSGLIFGSEVLGGRADGKMDGTVDPCVLQNFGLRGCCPNRTDKAGSSFQVEKEEQESSASPETLPHNGLSSLPASV